MTIETFFNKFDQFADAPNAVTKTRELVLQYVSSRDVWRIFWKRSNGKWHGYQPNPQVDSLAAALRVIDEDAHHCFFWLTIYHAHPTQRSIQRKKAHWRPSAQDFSLNQ